MRNIVCAKYQVADNKVGDQVSVTSYVPAQVGSGMSPKETVEGRLVSVGSEVRCYGCSTVWVNVVVE